MTPNTWKVMHVPDYRVRALHSSLQIPRPLCALLVRRGFTRPEQARAFLQPDVAQMHDPFLFKQMNRAVARLEEALVRGESILLYGDYDVDGVSAVALMIEYLRTRRGRVRYYLPDRATEGYGLSGGGLQYAIRTGCSLVIALDCGIRNTEIAREARRMGLDLIICDHHSPGIELPVAHAIINPLCPDENYPSPHLSGCALAFKLVQAHAGIYAQDSWCMNDILDLVALSLGCDIIPLIGESRVLAYLGMAKLQDQKRPGLRAIWALSGRNPPFRISDLVFGAGPRLNAAGRLADADLAMRCLLARNDAQAMALAEQLEERNQIRREHDTRMTEEAMEQYEQSPWMRDRCSAVLYSPHWHRGLLGIVAARVAERIGKPTLVLTREGPSAVGSGRSAAGVSLVEALERCHHWLHQWGGHRQAAGLTISVGDIPVFSDYFEEAVKDQAPNQEGEVLHADGSLLPGDIDATFVKALARFAPFGPGNRNPRFVWSGLLDTGHSRILKDAHLKLSLKSRDGQPLPGGIAFGQASDYALLKSGRPVDICASIKTNVWGGRERIQLDVKAIRPSEVSILAGRP